MPKLDDLIIENANILFRNFAGEPSQFNPNGRRTFTLVLDDDEIAEKLSNDGWNVKIRTPKEGQDFEPYKFLNCELKFIADAPNVRRDPEVYLVSYDADRTMHKTRLTAETVGMLDSADISNIDIDLTPYHWNANGNSGVKAYVRTMYVTIKSDVFADKYAAPSDEEIPF